MTIQPARHECHACCPLQAEKPGIQPVVGNTHGTHVEQVVSSFQKILRGSQLTWYVGSIATPHLIVSSNYYFFYHWKKQNIIFLIVKNRLLFECKCTFSARIASVCWVRLLVLTDIVSKTPSSDIVLTAVSAGSKTWFDDVIGIAESSSAERQTCSGTMMLQLFNYVHRVHFKEVHRLVVSPVELNWSTCTAVTSSAIMVSGTTTWDASCDRQNGTGLKRDNFNVSGMFQRNYGSQIDA